MSTQRPEEKDFDEHKITKWYARPEADGDYETIDDFTGQDLGFLFGLPVFQTEDGQWYRAEVKWVVEPTDDPGCDEVEDDETTEDGKDEKKEATDGE